MIDPKKESALDIQVGGSHYKECAIQPVEYIAKNNLNFIAGNIVKYASRVGKKGDKNKWIEDIDKIKHYCDLWKELL